MNRKCDVCGTEWEELEILYRMKPKTALCIEHCLPLEIRSIKNWLTAHGLKEYTIRLEDSQ